MNKTVFASTTTLFPRLDATYPEIMQQSVRDLQEANPEWATLHWVVRMEEYSNGTGKLYIAVIDKNAQPDNGVVMLIGVAIIAFLIIILYFL